MRKSIFTFVQKVFGVVAFIGLFGMYGTAGASDLNQITDSRMYVQLIIFGLMFIGGIIGSGVLQYQYDIETGEEWIE